MSTTESGFLKNKFKLMEDLQVFYKNECIRLLAKQIMNSPYKHSPEDAFEYICMGGIKWN